jgi:hypothetical protein
MVFLLSIWNSHPLLGVVRALWPARALLANGVRAPGCGLCPKVPASSRGISTPL